MGKNKNKQVKFECQRCVLCCRTLPIDIGYSDIINWHNNGKWDILKEVTYLDNFPVKGQGGFYFLSTVHKKDGSQEGCHFLVDNICTIYEDKPMVCRDYPMNKVDCTCPNFVLSSSLFRNRSIKRQTKQFQKAIDNRHWLLTMLRPKKEAA